MILLRLRYGYYVSISTYDMYTQCTLKLRPNFQKIAQLECTTNEKRNLSEHDETNFKWNFFMIYRILL